MSRSNRRRNARHAKLQGNVTLLKVDKCLNIETVGIEMGKTANN